MKVEALDSDQRWFEDRNDDLINSKWVNDDGTFEIIFDTQQFQDAHRIEGKPDLYLIVRDILGQVVYKTEVRKGVDSSDIQALSFNITLDPLENRSVQPPPPDPYTSNNERVIEAFGRLGDVSEFQLEDMLRIFRLLNSSINAWSLYTTDYMWNAIGYDGPQVPKYPWRERGHSHSLFWEKNTNA